MIRRKFISQSALIASGLFLKWPAALHPDREDPVLGHNNKRYLINMKWSRADVTRYPVKDCHEMVQDQQGRIILLTNETKNNVIIYDRNGKLLKTWGHEYPGAHGLTLFNENGEDWLFICDNNRHQVIKTTVDGRVLLTIDYPKDSGQYSKPEEYIPTETAIAPKGDIYVADGYGKDLITRYDSTGRYISQFGGRGEGEAFLLNAHGICIDQRNKEKPLLVITSRMQNAFKRFTLEGEFIDSIPLPGAWVCRPVIKGEYLYTAVLQSNSRQWQQSGFVLILDKDYRVVSSLGGNLPVYESGVPEEMYQTIRVFQYPHDVCVDDEENIYVAQWNSGQVYPYKLSPV